MDKYNLERIENKTKLFEEHANCFGLIELNARQLQNDISYLVNEVRRLQKLNNLYRK